jgi:hypothetical protein
MERSALFYFLLGAGIVLVPAITDRLLKDRVANWLRIVLGFVAAALTGVALVLVARPLGL